MSLRKKTGLPTILAALIMTVAINISADDWVVGIDKRAEAGGASVIPKGIEINTPDSECRPHSVQIRRRESLKTNCDYRLSFKAESSAAANVDIVYTTAEPPYIRFGEAQMKLEPGKTDYECIMKIHNRQGVTNPDKRSRVLRMYFGANKNVKIKMTSFKLAPFECFPAKTSWQVFSKVKPINDMSKIPTQLTAKQNGVAITASKVQMRNNTIDLAKLSNGNFQVGDRAILYHLLESKNGETMKLGFAADWWMEVYVNGKKYISTIKEGNGSHNYSPDAHVCEIPLRPGRNLIAAVVLSGSDGWRFVCGNPGENKSKAQVIIKAGNEWKAVDTSSLQVKEGSALDRSSLVDAPAGKHGRVIINAKGELAFADNPSKAIRLHGFNGTSKEILLAESEEEFKQKAELFAIAVRRQGYSLVRLNMLECFLCADVDKDMAINPKYLKRWDWLLACLKKEGIYTHLVIASYGIYYSPFSFTGKIFKQRNINKLKMFIADEDLRRHWRFGAETLLNHVNPYTKLAWKDDPALASVEFFNEQEIGLGASRIKTAMKEHPALNKAIQKQWEAWLKDKFKNSYPPALSEELKETSTGSIPIPEMQDGKTPLLANEFALFINSLALKSAQWCEKIVRATGYKGVTAQYNFSQRFGFSAVRWQASQTVIANGYFYHPHNGIVGQGSSIRSLGAYWRRINSTHLAGRPFMVGEFNHTFWNPYQYECGLLFGSYSALQDYSSVMIHSGPVMLEHPANKVLRDFTCAYSPIVRANEFVASYAFQRRDVSKAKKNIHMLISNKFLDSDSNSFKLLNSEQTKLAMISSFSLEFPDLPKTPGVPSVLSPAAITLKPGGGGVAIESEWFTDMKDSRDGSFNLAECVAAMKKSGLISHDNLSDPDKGIFQSDTGEIILKAQENLLKVLTPKLEGICLETSKGKSLKVMRKIHSSVPAAITLCSIDAKPLEQSRRMVLVYSTQAANSNMVLSHNRQRMIKSGSLPILLRIGKLKIELNGLKNTEMKLYALSLDGTRKEELPVTYESGNLIINIDTSALKDGPTPFFELVNEKK